MVEIVNRGDGRRDSKDLPPSALGERWKKESGWANRYGGLVCSAVRLRSFAGRFGSGTAGAPHPTKTSGVLPVRSRKG